MMKKISVIIPCYNVEVYIDQCIRSLLSQTIGLEQMELIFVDDASTDDTRERLHAFERLYPEQMMVIELEENQRQGTARNVGMQYATGEYIGFVDSDDWIDPEMYQVMVERAEEYHCDTVSCQAYRNKADGSEVSEILTKERLFDNKQSAIVDGEWPAFFFGSVCKKIYRRDMLLHHELVFPEKLLYEDNYFTMVAAMYCKRGYHIAKCYYHYRENPLSTTQSRNKLELFDRLKIEVMKLDKFQEMGIFSRFHQEIETFFFELYYFNTLFMMATRFDVPPFSMFQQMKQEVLKWFPNYRENPSLCNEREPLWGILLRLLELDMGEEQFLRFMEKYAALPR